MGEQVGGTGVVVGFMGGRDRRDDDTQGVRKVAMELRRDRPRILVETFENTKIGEAHAFVTTALARAHEDLCVSVVYGQSLGGAAAVSLTRRLKASGIGVHLIVQIDSVGFRDRAIPDNVAHGANFFQTEGLFVKGKKRIWAESPDATMILGNWRITGYAGHRGSRISLEGIPWWKKAFQEVHLKMMHDEKLWEQVKKLVYGACDGEDLEVIASNIDVG